MTASSRRLPVAWDGRPVEWGPFEPATQMCRINADGTSDPLPQEVCWHCGVRSDRVYASGEVDIRPWRQRLTLVRCTRCGHDQVRDWAKDQVWDLDESDYGPAGSWEDVS